MFAFPEGLPGLKDLSKVRIHFVGHSMGAITVRYMQHLLKTGYFDEIAGSPKQDRGDMIFSLTCLSGANNGSLVVNNCGLHYDRDLADWIIRKNSRMMNAFKLTVVC